MYSVSGVSFQTSGENTVINLDPDTKYSNEYATLTFEPREVYGVHRAAPMFKFTSEGVWKILQACYTYREDEMWAGRVTVTMAPDYQKRVLATKRFLQEVLFCSDQQVDFFDIQVKIGDEIDPRVFRWMGVIDLLDQAARDGIK
jgi:hypothetical protein